MLPECNSLRQWNPVAAMKPILILNPAAGRAKSAAVEESLNRAFRKHGIPCEIAVAAKAGDGYALAGKAADEGYDPIIAGGGDGTVNGVINGLVGTDATLGIIPIGSVNVLARELGIPLDFRKAIQTIADGVVKKIDLGCANGRYFTLMAGFGFDAEVVANVVQPLKDMIGSSAYVLEGLETLARYRATNVVLEMPEGTYSTKAFLVMVANVSTYTYNLKITPHAAPDDGLLDVCVFERPLADKIGFMRQMAEVFIHRHLYHRAVRYFRTSKVTVRSDPEVMVQLDGDAFAATPVHASIAPSSLPVIVPAAPE